MLISPTRRISIAPLCANHERGIMVSGLASETCSELAIIQVSGTLASLPQPARDDVLWWSLVEGLIKLYPQIQRMGPPREITYDIIDSPDQIESIVVRHRCDSCQSSLDEAKRFLTDYPGVTLCIAQYELDFLIRIDPVGGNNGGHY